AVREIRLDFASELVELDAAPVTRAFLASLLRDVSARVNIVNAFLIAEERGIMVTTSYVRGGEPGWAIRVRVLGESGKHTVAGAIFGSTGGKREGRITEINDFRLEAIPHG